MTALSYAPRLATRVRDRVAFRYPELAGLLGLTALLNLWNLGVNGWANTYYSAAIRAMSTSWHDFLFGSLDQSGLMTLDKPPLAFWVQALSVRVFGDHPLSILVPEALMGVVAVGLLYDLTRRRFGRVAGFVAGVVFALTPMTVAVARHNNPDELLILCCVAALWCAVRALEAPTRSTKWLVWSGVFVGLGFEAKMGVALMVVPGIVAAYLWAAPAVGGRMRTLRQLAAGGAAMVAVGLAWPLLVTLTPAADRPWISGTSDNSVWSLIFGYNGLGRVAGQSGGPGGGATGGPTGGPGGGIMFGGATGPFRLLQSGLGDQAGWLLGAALVASAALLILSRARRRDPRTGWLLAVGGAFLVPAVVFSFAQGIFHPYYVSFLVPFAAALVGAGVGVVVPRSLGRAETAGPAVRIVAPLLIVGGAITELVVLGGLNDALAWATPVVILVGGLTAVMLAMALPARVRAALLVVALAALLAAPATWAVETVGHATSSTFPAGGPANADGGPGGGGGGFAPGGFGPRAQGFQGGPPPGMFPGAGGTGPLPPRPFGPGGRAGGFGGNSASLTAASNYAKTHGGGTVAIESQSSAAAAILSSGAHVAGIGGFSGRESSVTSAWLATEVKLGRLRWVLPDGGQGARLPGDTRTGSQDAISIVEKACKAVTVQTTSGASVTMYDCQGRASAVMTAARG